MFKKLLLAAISAGILGAFAAPPTVQADYLRETFEESEPLEVGAEIEIVSENMLVKTAFGTLECEVVKVHAHVAENGPSIHLTDTGTTTSGCNTSVTNPTIGTLTLEDEHGFATGMSITLASMCTFTGNVTYEYETTDDVITAKGSTLSGPCGTATASGGFTLMTPDTAPIDIF